LVPREKKKRRIFTQRFFRKLLPGKELKDDGKALFGRVLALFAFLALFSATAATSGESGT
jgi:hypothetical protein